MATTTAPGTSLDQMNLISPAIEQQILTVPEVAKVGRRIGRAERGEIADELRDQRHVLVYSAGGMIALGLSLEILQPYGLLIEPMETGLATVQEDLCQSRLVRRHGVSIGDCHQIAPRLP